MTLEIAEALLLPMAAVLSVMANCYQRRIDESRIQAKDHIIDMLYRDLVLLRKRNEKMGKRCDEARRIISRFNSTGKSIR